MVNVVVIREVEPMLFSNSVSSVCERLENDSDVERYNIEYATEVVKDKIYYISIITVWKNESIKLYGKGE